MSDKTPKIEVRVSEIHQVTPEIKRFHFKPVDGSLLPNFSGGAHVVVEMEDGATLRRNPYSLMSRPGDTACYTISVRRDDKGRGGSMFLHGKVRPGDVIRISHPVNLFPPDQRARKHLLFAGGIGITPFMAMMAQLSDEDRPFELHYAVRSDEHGAYLAHLAERYGRRVHIYRDDKGEAIALAELLARQPLGTHLYVCGPGGMIKWVLNTARNEGWPDQNLHDEQFIAPASGKPYEIILALSGKRAKVGPHQSMLEAIEAAGVDAPYLCRGGACGQCETRVLSCDGTLMHNDHYLSEADKASGAKVMPCVSRFEGRELVLDL
ncbi:2Fe-2S iron-sulfur cluster-binding protein [Labrys sp. KB_33_2]|uniref:PDR/VanB family oxidoreductase n=1 Tax=Labrys sp. KB_33_2 TaxID=3237479 RepID=UPI003F8F3BAB